MWSPDGREDVEKGSIDMVIPQSEFHLLQKLVLKLSHTFLMTGWFDYLERGL
jgi:hypothetical protein